MIIYKIALFILWYLAVTPVFFISLIVWIFGGGWSLFERYFNLGIDLMFTK